MRLVLAFVAAILAPVLLLTLWYLYGQFQVFESHDPYIWLRTRNFFILCLVIAGAHVVVLGLPTYLVLRRLRALRWWSLIGSGFVLGAIPFALYVWPLRYAYLHSSSTSDGVITMVDGHVTLAGWLQYASGVSFMGACGAVAALAFWLVSRAHEP
jgi:hypothetical protein